MPKKSTAKQRHNPTQSQKSWMSFATSWYLIYKEDNSNTRTIFNDSVTPTIYQCMTIWQWRDVRNCSLCVIWGFCCCVNEIFTLLGCYAAQSCSKQSSCAAWPLKIGPICRPETLATNHQSTLHNIPNSEDLYYSDLFKVSIWHMPRGPKKTFKP